MPPKRRADPEREGEGSSKRARTAENSDEEAEEAPNGRVKRERTAKGKGKARQVESSDEEEESQEEEDINPVTGMAEEVDDEAFEQENAAHLIKHLEKQRKSQGGIAEHGIIEAIEMHQFMCHKYLTFSFGPQINFIIGHNGSGKSAVLSAITVALGGKANSTGRGNGLKSFIREGQSVSEVTISLKNQGDEAYKPKEYGKSIVITRRFTKEGSSSWKIKSKDGRVISTKKDELAAICDHMNIQVDNPMTVLTQDAARQFLSASQPQDKYKFFLRGTQLSQLSDEYDTCLENITQTTKILAQKREALPDLRTTYRETSIRYEEAAKAREQKKKADDLKKELAWAHVRAKEEEMTAKIEEVEKAARRLAKIQDSVTAAEAAFEKASEDVETFETEHRALGNVEHLNGQKQDLQLKIRGNKERLSDYNNDLKQINTSLKSTNQQIDDLQRQIEEQTRRMAAHSQAKREETHRKLEEAKEAVTQAEQAMTAIQTEKRDQVVLCDGVKQLGMDADKHKTTLQGRIQEAEAMIERCTRQENDALVPYGRDIKKVLERIDQMRWVGDRPLGPLGVHVKAKDPTTWGELLRTQLGSFLMAFAVTDARDRTQLKRLLVESGNPSTLIVIYEKDLFEYRNGEPQENLLTVLRALDISDPYVLRILINQVRIERQLLAYTRKEGEDILQSLRGGGSAWTKDLFNVRVFPEGGISSGTIQTNRGRNDAMNLLLTGRDTASEIQHYRQLIQSLQDEYKESLQTVNTYRAQFGEYRAAIERLSYNESQAYKALNEAKNRVRALQTEANDEMPADFAALEDAKQEAEGEKENLVNQFTDVMRQKTDVDEAQKALMNEMKEIKVQIDKFAERGQAAMLKVENAATARLSAQSNKKHYEAKLADEKRKVDIIEEAAKVLQQEFTNWTEKAEAYCPRVANPRKVDDVQRNLDSVQKALKEREKRQGASVEELANEVNKAKERLEKAEKELKQMSVLNKALKASLIVRLSRWQEFRRHIALRCKLVFQFHLSHRGYFGKVLFNHDQGTLMLKVQTDDQIATQTRDKDPRSLSGGEKSFSTICLLLSLWESIGCPLRCLDEFDVFMDAVNRRISMKMMIDTANSSDKKQYVLITPQDMTNVQFGPSVRVHRMTDPERGNGVLAFSG